MKISSDSIKLDGSIMQQYTCDGEGSSPSLTFSELPEEAASLAFIIDDPDAPGGVFTHWLLYDMPPSTLQISENGKPLVGKTGTNGFGKIGYGGPCPPNGTHRYIFKLYALDTTLNLPVGINSQKLKQALEGHILETAELVGTYTRQK